ncbi:MAG: AbrB/MazE/SpoVT family DNA-binding domain-containing protein [Clostridia bacterium]|nr:AbrB/MazE/SpoVT family DNA-binding domain-containing protein [Clostridia bacterium]
MAKLFRILGKRGRITIPYEIRQRVGFRYNDVLSFEESADGRSVVVKREKICDNCKREQPVKEDEVTLFDFLNGLSPEQQHAALVHLHLMWAERKGGEADGTEGIV